MDLPQLVQRIMFAGGQAAAVCLGQIQLFVGICLAGEKIRLRQQRRVEQRIVPGIAGSKAVPDPQLRLRQQAMKDPALLPPGGLARSFAGLRRPVPDKAPAVERGWRKMVGGELQEALQQVTAGGDAGVQDHLPAHRRQPAKNLLQVVPAGVAGHLRIVPAGAEQPTAEKGIVDIDGIHRQGVVQLFEFPAHIFAQQIVQFAHGHHHPGMAQRYGARWTIAQIDLPGLRWVDRQGGAFPVAWFRLIESRIQSVGRHRLPAIGLRRARSGKLQRMLFTILARRHAVLALKQIAHHSRTGESLFAGDLLDGFAGG